MASAITFQQIALAPIIRGLKNAAAFVAKGEKHTKVNNIDPAEFTSASIHPDMKDFSFQVWRFTDAAKFVPTRVDPSFEALELPDVETTFPDLLARINRTIEYLEKFEAKSFDGKEGNPVTLGPASGAWSIQFEALQYVQFYAQPNFWFHVTTAYDILRMKGVDVGKMDFLNGAGLMQIKKKEE